MKEWRVEMIDRHHKEYEPVYFYEGYWYYDAGAPPPAYKEAVEKGKSLFTLEEVIRNCTEYEKRLVREGNSSLGFRFINIETGEIIPGEIF